MTAEEQEALYDCTEYDHASAEAERAEEHGLDRLHHNARQARLQAQMRILDEIEAVVARAKKAGSPSRLCDSGRKSKNPRVLELWAEYKEIRKSCPS